MVSLRIDADRMLRYDSIPVFNNVNCHTQSFYRSQIALTLTEGSNIDPTDVLVLSQTISPLGFGFNCVNVSARVLGDTRKKLSV